VTLPIYIRGVRLLSAFAMVALAASALGSACSSDEPGSASESLTVGAAETVTATAPEPEPAPTVEQPPGSVAQTRAAILAAASALDYDALEPLVDAQLFLPDAGFGVDPVTHWRDQGTAPLEAMAVLLAMPHTVRETNEGTFYQWPRFTADSDPGDMSIVERKALVTLLGEPGLNAAFQPETGYIAPRLGILSDGRWWFFIMEPAP
jgi:hypothetical protein